MKKTVHKHILTLALAAVMPASLSAAPSVANIGFNTDGNLQGFTAYSSATATFSVNVAGGVLTGTSPGGDPRLVYNSSTPIFTKPAGVTWTNVRFRVRETDETPAIVTPWSASGINVVINGVTGAGGATTIASTEASAVDSGDGYFTVTVAIPAAFTANEIRYFRFDPIGGTDAAGNKFEVDFVEATMGNTPPVLVSTIPTDGATGVDPAANLVATFDEAIFLNSTGSITIKNLTTSASTVISLGATDPDGTITVAGSELTIDPAVNPGVPGDVLAIEISSDAIKDADGASYAGIPSVDDPSWSFTIDNLPPVVTDFQPKQGSSNSPLDGLLFLTFDENVVVGSGNIVIHRTTDNSVVETIPVTSGNVVVSGTRVTITPTVPLSHATAYHVLIGGGTFVDALGNAFPGISQSTGWAFSTVANDPTVLFADSFNREDGSNPDASARGKYGQLSPLAYVERLIGQGNIELSRGQLLVQSIENNGNSGGLIYPDHNFTDAAVLTAGGFSISVDLNAYASGGTTRYMSVAVGQSSTELQAQTTVSASSPAIVGDLVVSYRKTNNTLEIRENGGTAIVTPSLPAPPARMRIEYTVADFNAGSLVSYKVYFNDSATVFAAGDFTWSGSNENYISVASNLINTGVAGERNALFDNLQIRTLGGAGAAGFEAWKAANNTTGGLDGDHDDDGVTNGIEYFIGGPNGVASGFTLLPGVEPDGGALSVTFTKAADYDGVYGTHYRVETSTTLAGPWSPQPASPEPDFTVTFPSPTEVKFTFPDLPGGTNFARLVVTGP